MQFLELFICMLLNCLISDLKNSPFNISKFTYKAKNKHDGIVDFNSGKRHSRLMKIRRPFSPRGGNLVLVERG